MSGANSDLPAIKAVLLLYWASLKHSASALDRADRAEAAHGKFLSTQKKVELTLQGARDFASRYPA